MTQIDIAALVADLTGPIPFIEGLSGPYPDETAIRDTADQAAAALIAQDAEIERLTARAEAAEAETKAVADDQNRLMQSFIAIEDERDKLRNQVAAITENRDRLMGYYNTLMDDNTRLRADLANAGAVMVEACARKADEHYAAGDMGNPGHHIRALSPLSPIAAAAGVLIPVFEEKHRDYMTSKGRDPDHYSSSYSMAVQDLRAIAEQEKADG